MKIGIDISQSIYEGTGVAEYTTRLVSELLRIDTQNDYILFFSHPRLQIQNLKLKINAIDSFASERTGGENSRVTIKQFRIPVQLLELLWNRLHIFPIEWFIGDVDIFLSSDWLEPPTKRAKKITTIHDLSVLQFPDSYDEKIKSVHMRKLKWAVKECHAFFCDSEATKKDAMKLLGIKKDKLRVVYLGID